MSSKRATFAVLALILVTLSCAPATPTPTTEPPVPPTDTSMAPAPTDTTPPDATAPSPLPVSNTGIILNEGECYDLDNGSAPYVLDGDCDILLVSILTLQPQNGAQLSGYADLSAPSLATCMGKAFDAGDLAPNTDLYICFLSDEGHYGFIVQRPDGAPFDVSSHRLVFDWWLYE
jgi:hypothetical protein